VRSYLGTAIQALYYNDLAKANQLGTITGSPLRSWQFSDDLTPPAWAIFESGDHNTFLIVIAGTTNQDQWMANANFPPIISQEYGGAIHGAWLGIWQSMRASIRAALPNNLTGKRIVVTGHSFGAALATLAAVDYSKIVGAENTRLVTFASPRVGNFLGNFPALNRHWNMVNDGDLVTGMPPVSLTFMVPSRFEDFPVPSIPIPFSHVAPYQILDGEGSIWQTDQYVGNSILDPRNLTNPVAVHMMPGYLQRLIIANQADERPEFNPALLQINQAIANLPAVIPGNQNLQPSDYINSGDANSGLFPGGSSPISNSNINTIQSVVTTYEATLRRFTSHKDLLPENSMALFRATFIFDMPRRFGWSETYYNNKLSYNAVMDDAQALASKRRALLGDSPNQTNPSTLIPGSCKMKAIRISNDLVSGDAKNFAFGPNSGFSTNNAATACDVPQVALLLSLKHNEIISRSLHKRGIPDTLVVNGGQWQPTPQYTALLTEFCNELKNGSWCIKSSKSTDPKQTVTAATFSEGWTITTDGNHNLASGDYVRLTEMGTNSGLNGRWRVVVTSANTYRLIEGPPSETFSGFGPSQKQGTCLVPITDVQFIDVANRQTGLGFTSTAGANRRR
jgi:hypothetical protein